MVQGERSRPDLLRAASGCPCEEPTTGRWARRFARGRTGQTTGSQGDGRATRITLKESGGSRASRTDAQRLRRSLLGGRAGAVSLGHRSEDARRRSVVESADGIGGKILFRRPARSCGRRAGRRAGASTSPNAGRHWPLEVDAGCGGVCLAAVVPALAVCFPPCAASYPLRLGRLPHTAARRRPCSHPGRGRGRPPSAPDPPSEDLIGNRAPAARCRRYRCQG